MKKGFMSHINHVFLDALFYENELIVKDEI